MLGVGFLIGAEAVGMEFMPDCDYRACMLCGTVYQSDLDRLIGRFDRNPTDGERKGNPPPTVAERTQAADMRRKWAEHHATHRHQPHEHAALWASGMTCTPEAAQVLVNYGIIPLSDMVLSPEHAAAAREAPRAPTKDVEGS